jgi:cyclopropane-fatty-acyl-phospholipid synthase
MSYTKQKLTKLLDQADVQINGSRPGDIVVHDERFYRKVATGGSLALGESYMDGWWDCNNLDIFFYKVLKAKLNSTVKNFWQDLIVKVANKIFNYQSKTRAFIVGEKHYDLGNDLYEGMLDKRLVYTCGYWSGKNSLDEAQEAKLDLVCRKIGLKPGMTVLDIGCGWGSFAKFAAERYGAHVTGITISKEQVVLAKERCSGLPVEILLQDYRDTTGQYDVIISLGMFEHVGIKNYRTYMEVAARCLKPDGLFLLHTIGSGESGIASDPWLDKYIFPNGVLPTVSQISASFESLFVMEDWHNFGPDYDKTLMAWYNNFVQSWPKIKSKYNDRFYRMWSYYLLCCAGSFRARNIQLWQVVLSKNGVEGGYKSIR